MTLECISRGGSPLQTVNWYRDNVNKSPLNSVSTVNTVDGKHDVTVRYNFTPEISDDRSLYICQSSYPTEPRLLSQSVVQILLNCKYECTTTVKYVIRISNLKRDGVQVLPYRNVFSPYDSISILLLLRYM